MKTLPSPASSLAVESAEAAAAPASRTAFATRAWRRALERTAPIAQHPQRILPAVVEELADTRGAAPALLAARESLTYRDLAERSNRYARWALDAGLGTGDVVCLLMPNRPEYMAIWLGITRVGGVVALLNTNLTGGALAHCINIVGPKHIVVATELVEALSRARPHLVGAPAIRVHGAGRDEFPRIDRESERFAGDRLRGDERRPVTIEDRALLIYTSGTTGLPKAAHVSHFRLVQWSHWFAGMIDVQASDRMYNCLPMYHSVGGVLATGAVLVGGGSVVVREKFSARRFWADIRRWDCTLVQYIGELCRYLLQADRAPGETAHRVRMCCGNGLGPDVWTRFRDRFRIPHILEFYAATEGTVSLFNIDGRPGAVGRMPPFLAHRARVAVVKVDIATNDPIRNEQGWCVRCAPNEVGEAIGKVSEDPGGAGGRFEGYTSREASDARVLRGAFEPGDAWFRTGDLMRRDEEGYFYFVDRLGDTFRWRGENVATREVSEAICAFPGIREAAVYGVPIPGTDGRAGMAALVADADLDLVAFRAHLVNRLPPYARPVFLRLRREIEVTTTWKHVKRDLVRQGYDPAATTDALYVDDPERQAFVRLDPAGYERIQAGQVRL